MKALSHLAHSILPFIHSLTYLTSFLSSLPHLPPKSLLRVVHRVRGLMSSSLTSPQLTSLSLSVTVSVACPNGSQWVPMGPNGS